MLLRAVRGAYVWHRTVLSRHKATSAFQGFPSSFVNCVLIASPFGFYLSVPDTAPTDVGGGGGTKSELVITWEVSHLSHFTVLSIGK